MIIKCKLKRRGKSLWAIIPKNVVESEQIKEHEWIKLLLVKNSQNVLKETFGMLKGKSNRSTEEILREVDKEWYNRD